MAHLAVFQSCHCINHQFPGYQQPLLPLAGSCYSSKNPVMIFDSLYYALEQKVASFSIPRIGDVGRISLDDYPYDASIGKSVDHSDWTKVLQKHVSPSTATIDEVVRVSTVDYTGIRTDERFQSYLSTLDACDPTELQVTEQFAFWMNAYNALCINLIVNAESSGKELASINDLSTKDTKVWDMEAGKINGKTISLNQIEHDKLRRCFTEPRVHACIVCASASCPNLRSEAFDAAKLNAQMDDQMKDWVSNPTKGVHWNGRALELSRIFLWFAEDFGELKGVRTFLAPYVADDMVKKKLPGKAPVKYFEYSWKINRTSK